MSRPSRWRDNTIAALARAGVTVDDSRKLLRYATTLERLAEAQCNGDWPCDNGERKVVPCGGAEQSGCGSYWVPSVLKGPGRLCPDCRTGALVRKVASSYGLAVEIAGDPRGPVLTIGTVPVIP